MRRRRARHRHTDNRYADRPQINIETDLVESLLADRLRDGQQKNLTGRTIYVLGDNQYGILIIESNGSVTKGLLCSYVEARSNFVSKVVDNGNGSCVGFVPTAAYLERELYEMGLRSHEKVGSMPVYRKQNGWRTKLSF